MDNQQHPITPPPELATSLRDLAPHGILNAGVIRELWLIEHAYSAGANYELEACVEWFDNQSLVYHRDLEHALRAARRPKTPSLKAQALAALKRQAFRSVPSLIATEDCNTIRKALEALDD